MSFFKENKLLAGFLCVALVVTLAMVVLTFIARGKYTQINEDFAIKLNELKRLENSKPYPNSANLNKFSEEKKNYEAKLNELLSKINDYEFPLEDVSSNEFQNILYEAVQETESKASGKTTLPEEFYLGFDRYENELPNAQAAPELARHVGAMKSLISTMIDAGVNEITEINRQPLPVESGATSEEDQSDAKPLVVSYPVNVSFTCDPRELRKVVNEITSDDKFYIIRTLLVENETQEGPKRGQADSIQPVQPQSATTTTSALEELLGESDAAQSAPADGASGGTERIQFIVGDEKLNVALRVEIVDFQKPEEAEAPPAS